MSLVEELDEIMATMLADGDMIMVTFVMLGCATLLV